MFESKKSVESPQPSPSLSPDLESAVFWRGAVWALACKFSDNQCEMTHSEAEYRSGAIASVAFCVSFFEKPLADFSEYVRAHLHKLGAEHSHMRVYVGFNYGNPGLITVQGGQVTFDQNQDILDLPEMLKLPYGSNPSEREAIERTEDDIWNRVTKALEGSALP